MKKRDIVLIVILAVISLCGIIPSFFGRDIGDAYIYVKGSLYGVYDLSEPCDITITGDNGALNTVTIEDNGIFMKEANCPGRQCIECGRISRNGESICCAPAGILIIVRSQEEPEYDAVTR